MADSGAKENSDQTRVMMWCTPRSTSSVFCKCMSSVPDIDIFFDTYYFAFEAEFNLKEVGTVVDHDKDDLGDDVWLKAAATISEEDCSGDRVKLEMLKYPVVKRMLDNPDPTKKVIFYKGVSQSMDTDHYRFLPDAASNYTHSFYLRHPAKVFLSWRKIIYSVLKEVGDGSGNKLTKPLESFHIVKDAPEKYNLSDLLYKNLYDLWKHVKKNIDPNPVVIESDDLLADPARMLSKYCGAVGIPYSDSLLQWDPTPTVTDQWKSAFMPPNDFEFIRLFCKNAFHTSYYFKSSPVPALESLTDDVREAVEKSMPFYNEMYETRLML